MPNHFNPAARMASRTRKAWDFVKNLKPGTTVTSRTCMDLLEANGVPISQGVVYSILTYAAHNGIFSQVDKYSFKKLPPVLPPALPMGPPQPQAPPAADPALTPKDLPGVSGHFTPKEWLEAYRLEVEKAAKWAAVAAVMNVVSEGLVLSCQEREAFQKKLTDSLGL